MERLPRLRKVKGVNKIKQKRERILKERKKKKAESKPKTDQEIVRNKPLTSVYELQKTRKEINALNRDRAKRMERRVAGFLRGQRTILSGAWSGQKGDCTVPLISGGNYLVECKLSANESKGESRIILSLEWFDKTLKDARSMNARFGVLVIHYHGKSEDYVFVPGNAMRYIATYSVHGRIIDLVREDILPRDISIINDRKRSVYGLYQKDLEAQFIDVKGIKVAAFILPSGIWYCFYLSQYRDLLEGV